MKNIISTWIIMNLDPGCKDTECETFYDTFGVWIHRQETAETRDQYALKLAALAVHLQACIGEAHSSPFDWAIGCPDCDFSQNSLVSPGQCRFFSSSFQVIIHRSLRYVI
jgi:hypothetical protein